MSVLIILCFSVVVSSDLLLDLYLFPSRKHKHEYVLCGFCFIVSGGFVEINEFVFVLQFWFQKIFVNTWVFTEVNLLFWEICFASLLYFSFCFSLS